MKHDPPGGPRRPKGPPHRRDQDAPPPKRRHIRQPGEPTAKRTYAMDAWFLHGEGPAREAIQAGKATALVLDQDRTDKAAGPLKALARQHGVPVKQTRGGTYLDGRPRAVAVAVAPPLVWEESDFFANVSFKSPFLTLFPAGVQDPQNLGAILRSLAAFGHTHLWQPAQGSAPLSPAVLTVSRGGLLATQVTRLQDPTGAVSRFKDQGGLILAADLEGEPLVPRKLTRPTLLILGAEGEGVPPRLLRQADEVLCIPQRGLPGSLNVSAAAAVFLYCLES